VLPEGESGTSVFTSGIVVSASRAAVRSGKGFRVVRPGPVAVFVSATRQEVEGCDKHQGYVFQDVEW
jgi:hypothetical protein